MEDIKTTATALASGKGMTLEKFHTWLLNKPREVSCCRNGKCEGTETTIDSLTFRVRGHCRRLLLEAKKDDGEYVLINEICDY